MSVYSYAGVSRRNGKMKVRYANSSARVKTLIATDHTEIDIIQLREEMTKSEAVAYLLKIDFDNGNTEIRTVLEAEATRLGVENSVVTEDEIA
jgi:hypothetical protein